jgi:hypothetical protein
MDSLKKIKITTLSFYKRGATDGITKVLLGVVVGGL